LSGRGESPRAPDLSPTCSTVALVLPTSGSTARSKWVPLTHGNVHASAGAIATALGLGPADRCLGLMLPNHVQGLVILAPSPTAGSRVVCPPSMDARQFFAWLDEFRPTWYSAVPTMHQAILSEAARQPEPIARASLRFVRSCS